MAAGCGAGIYAAAAGTVTMSQVYSGYGNYVRIDHGGGIGTGYGHASQLLVSRGQWVNAGQLIAREGMTGVSFGCHLHFEVYTPGGTVNAQPFMAARGVSL
jgi:Membrane proteins related to metalloendopeptidases